MKAPSRKRPRRREFAKHPDMKRLATVARRAKYTGSPEHKRGPSFAGRMRPRRGASICSPHLNDQQRQLTRWLRQAITAGQVSEAWEGDFPKYAWYRDQNLVYEARLINRGTGEYKGFPLNAREYPSALV